MTLFKTLILSAKRKNLLSVLILLSMKTLNIFFQNDDLNLSFFRSATRTFSKRQIRQISLTKKRQSNQINEKYLFEFRRQKKTKQFDKQTKIKNKTDSKNNLK